MRRKGGDKMEFFVAYIRVSQNPNENKVSPHTQLEALKQYGEQLGFQIYNENGYTDNNVSGGLNFASRSAWSKMMNDCENLNIKNILFYDLSRLVRETFFFSDIVRECREKDIKMYSYVDRRQVGLNKGQEISDDFIMDMIKSMFNHRVLVEGKEKVKKTMRDIVLTGCSVGGRAPYGLINSTKEIIYEGKRTIRGSKALGDPDKVSLVKQIYDWYLSGKSDNEIVKILNKDYLHLINDEMIEEIRTRNGSEYAHLKENNAVKFWQKTTVSRILTNPSYTGFETSKRRKPVLSSNGVNTHVKNEEENWIWSNNFINRTGETDFPAIIPYSKWLAVQNLRKSRIKYKNDGYHPRNVKSPYLLSSILFCGTCQRKMIGRSMKGSKSKLNPEGKKYYYYYCKTPSVTTDICPNSQKIKREEIDNQILNLFTKPVLIYFMLQELDKYYSNSQVKKSEVDNIHSIDYRISILKKHKENLLTQLKENSTPRLNKVFMEEVDKIEYEIEVLTEKRNKLAESTDEINDYKLKLFDFVNKFIEEKPTSVEDLSEDEFYILKVAVKSIVDKVIYDKQYIDIHFKLFKEKFEMRICPDAGHVKSEIKKQNDSTQDTLEILKAQDINIKTDDAMLIRVIAYFWQKQFNTHINSEQATLLADAIKLFNKKQVKQLKKYNLVSTLKEQSVNFLGNGVCLLGRTVDGVLQYANFTVIKETDERLIISCKINLSEVSLADI